MNPYKCKKCNYHTFHYEFHDSYFCAFCNSWNDDKCGDTECYYCARRPFVPFDIHIHSSFLKAYNESGFAGFKVAVEEYLESE